MSQPEQFSPPARVMQMITGTSGIVVDLPDNSPSLASLMDLNMMVMLPGRERALKEYKALLDASGLKFERVIQTHSPFQIIEASRK